MIRIRTLTRSVPAVVTAGALLAFVATALPAAAASAPTAPTMNVTTDLALDGTTVGWSAPPSDGGSPLTGYDVEYSVTSSFDAPSSLTTQPSVSSAS